MTLNSNISLASIATEPLASGARLRCTPPPAAFHASGNDPLFCGAVVRGSRLCVATVIRSRRGLRIWSFGCSSFELTGLEQDEVRQFNTAVSKFFVETGIGGCGVKGPSNLDDMLTWMLFQKIETTLQLQRNLQVHLISPSDVTDWYASSAPQHPPMLRRKDHEARGLFRETIKVAAFIAAGGRVDD
jgi:hypothetical protein